VLVGSGTTAETVRTLGADAYIVGTALQTGGRVDLGKVLAMVRAARGRG
jgi:predicted TIM-barrel enzyme